MTAFLIILAAIGVISGLFILWLVSQSRPVIKIPCPYCGNPNRLDNGNAVARGLNGNCEWSTNVPAPCICDDFWLSRYGP